MEEDAAVLEMPFTGENDAISMTVILPNENSPNAVNSLLEKCTAETIHKALTEVEIQKVDIKFPKLSMKREYYLSKVGNQNK